MSQGRLGELRRRFRSLANLVHHEDHFGKRRALLDMMEGIYTEATQRAEQAESNVVAHPGEHFKARYIDSLDLTVVEIAKRIHVAEGRLQQFVDGGRRLDPETAIRIGAFTNTSPRMWMRMQAAWDLQVAMARADKIAAGIVPLDPKA